MALMEHLRCNASGRLHHGQDGGAGNGGCARCGSPAALEAVVDVLDARVFIDSCQHDASVGRSSQDADADQELPLPLPTVTVIRDAGRDCAVCLEGLEPGASALVTPCSHLYHPRCVTPWVEARGTCPLCRARVVAGDRDGLVMCHFGFGEFALGRRVAGRVSDVRLFDANGEIPHQQPPAPCPTRRRRGLGIW